MPQLKHLHPIHDLQKPLNGSTEYSSNEDEARPEPFLGPLTGRKELALGISIRFETVPQKLLTWVHPVFAHEGSIAVEVSAELVGSEAERCDRGRIVAEGEDLDEKLWSEALNRGGHRCSSL